MLPSGRQSNSLHDKGLQPERTALAWRRTGLACVLAGLLYLHLAFQAPLVALVGGLTLTGVGATVVSIVAPRAPTDGHLSTRRVAAAVLLLVGLVVGAVAIITLSAWQLATDS